MSGSSPGDLVRTISRVLDAVRQLGNLPFVPIRSVDSDIPVGIHPDIRRLCRQAARALDRYPVKDTFALEAAVEEEEEEEADSMDDDMDISNEGTDGTDNSPL
jgi:hypothetical protein